MKQLLAFLFVLVLIFGFSLQTHAALELRGVDTYGNRLIYDSDLNITWYDYTNVGANVRGFGDTWQNQMNWASALTVNFGGTIYDDWRLPTTVDGPYVFGYDGTTTGGYNITNSEMGHLFYAELGNNGYFDIKGSYTGCAMDINQTCLTITGPFQNLRSAFYVSSTPFTSVPFRTWGVNTYYGVQGNGFKEVADSYGIAVHAGDVGVAPEPISSILFLTGGATLIGRKYIRRKKKEV